MIITTLGTSHGDPTASAFCTAVLINVDGRHYLIDAGEPANASLVRRGLCASNLSGIFITHMHSDHTGSLPVLCEQADKARKRFPDITLEVRLPEQNAITALDAWRAANHTNRFSNHINITAYAPGTIFDDNNIRVTAFPTRHLEPLHDPHAVSYALKLTTAKNTSVLFSGDLAQDFADFPLGAANGCTAVFLEITHYNLEQAILALATLNIGQLIFYHVHNPWQTAQGRLKALRLCRHLPYPVSFSFDGFTTTL